MKRFNVLFMVLISGIFFVVGCSSNSDGGGDGWPTDEDPTDTGAAPAPGWTIEKVGNLSLGGGLDMSIDDNDVMHIAFWEAGTFNVNGELCFTDDPFAEDDDQYRRNLHYATRAQGDTDWTFELIDTPKTHASPSEMDMKINPSGEPVVAYVGGDGGGFSYCGANDGVLATRGSSGWATQIYAVSSGQAPGPAESTNGEIVGYYPAIAYDGNGDPAVVYKDVHNVVLQADDAKRADGEIYFGPGGGSHEMYDGSVGAGDHGSLVFDDQGRAVVFYAITVHRQDEDRYGVWAARRESDGTWLRTTAPLWSTNIKTATNALVDPADNSLVVAFYNGDSNPAVRVMRLTDHTLFDDPAAWSSEFAMDPRYQEGDHVSMALAPNGALAVAYRRCKRLTSEGGCNVNDTGLIFAIKEAGKWTVEAADLPRLGDCGEFVALDFTSDGTVHIAYRCTDEIEPDDTDNTGLEFGHRLFVASKKVVEVP